MRESEQARDLANQTIQQLKLQHDKATSLQQSNQQEALLKKTLAQQKSLFYRTHSLH